VRLLSGTSVLAAVTLVATDVQAGFANVRVSSLADGVHSFTAQVADAAGNVSPASTKTSIAIDTAAPAAVTLAISSSAVTIDANDARSYVISGGGAEVGSTIELQVTRVPGAPAIYYATPDSVGHFATQVNAGSGGAGITAISARAVDAAGNASAAVDGQLTVQAAGTPNTVEGLEQTDELVSGMSGPDVFVAGAGPRQDYFIGAGAFDIVRMSGAQADYALSFVPSAQRAVHQNLLGSGAALQADVPLVRIAGRGASSGQVVFFQAEAVEFSDGTVRITSQDVVSASGAQSVSGGAGNDRLFAANSGQRLSGGAGDDVLVGGIGPDTLVSTVRSSATTGRTLIGGGGDDTFQIGGDSASAGSRVVAHGGSGRDRFQLDPAEGFDVNLAIRDLRPGEDRIDLSALRVRQGAALRALTAADLNLPALSAALASSSHAAEIDLSAFATASGAPIRGTLHIELSPYGVPTLEPGDFILTGS
jgi:Ca2+-binding RTX toxin-like protein